MSQIGIRLIHEIIHKSDRRICDAISKFSTLFLNANKITVDGLKHLQKLKKLNSTEPYPSRWKSDGQHSIQSRTMSDYFKPLRRKIGLLTLPVACVFVALWVAGSEINPGYFDLLVQHDDECLHISGQIDLPANLADIPFDQLIPYSLFAIPLTLLSAWLLLSRPRTGKLSSESSPNPEP